MPDLSKALRAEDLDSRSLAALGDYLARRLDYLRKQNDKALDPVTTNMVRGAIQECNHMAALVQPKVIPHAKPGDALGVDAIDESTERWIRTRQAPE